MSVAKMVAHSLTVPVHLCFNACAKKSYQHGFSDNLPVLLRSAAFKGEMIDRKTRLKRI